MNVENVSNKELLLELVKRIKEREIKFNFSYYVDSGEISIKLSDVLNSQKIELSDNYNAEELYLKKNEWEQGERERNRIKSNNTALCLLFSNMLKNKG